MCCPGHQGRHPRRWDGVETGHLGQGENVREGPGRDPTSHIGHAARRSILENEKLYTCLRSLPRKLSSLFSTRPRLLLLSIFYFSGDGLLVTMLCIGSNAEDGRV